MLVAAWTQTEDPWCLHKMFNTVWRALWLERRATIATWWQEIWNLPKLQWPRQVAARTLAAISESKKAKGLYVSPSLADNVKHIFDFFPFSPEVLKINFWRNFLSLDNAGRGKYSCHQPRGTGSPREVQVQSNRIFLPENLWPCLTQDVIVIFMLGKFSTLSPWLSSWPTSPT